MKKGRAVLKSERDTYDRLVALMYKREIGGFRLADRDQWEVYMTAEDAENAHKLSTAARVVLTQKQVREKFQMDVATKPS